ncbi:hypothetical protein [Streptomyces sp. NPDC006368]|uniref:hypothetical protein n=1 Tax=Streptomyces sp. NPDC006368 TaxID=3156760 RepID=UPI0033B2256E
MPSPKRRHRTAALCALVVLPASLTALTAVAPASARNTDDVYAVAMGDSFIAGEAARWKGNAEGDWSKGGVPAEAKAATDRVKADGLTLDSIYPPREAGCHRSDTAEILAAKQAPSPHGEVEFTANLACSGAQTKNVLSDPYKSERPQLEQLKDLLAMPQIKVGHVVLSVGGAALPDTIRKCAESWKTNAYCSVNPSITGPMLKSVESVEKDAADTVGRIKAVLADAGSSARIILQSYPATLAPGDPATTVGDENSWTRWGTFGCPFYNRDLAWLDTQVYPALSAALKKAATAQKVGFLDVRRINSGHEVCHKDTHQAEVTTRGHVYLPSAADAQWARYFERSRTALPASEQAESLHPNHYGQQALQSCLSDALERTARADEDLALSCTGAKGKSPADITTAVDG